MGKKTSQTVNIFWNTGIYSSLRTLIHLIVASQFWFGIYYDLNHVIVPKGLLRNSDVMGGKLKYLTFIDAIIQAIYFTVALTNDIFGTNEVTTKELPLIRKLKDYLLASLAFPVAMIVGITFWALMAIDRELVFPKVLDAFFPSWLNHVMHTNIMVFIILELFISFRTYPNRNKGLMGLSIFMGSYLIWLHVIRHYSGFWAYPILDILKLPHRMLFFLAVLCLTLAFYILGEFLNSKIWTKELKIVAKKSK